MTNDHWIKSIDKASNHRAHVDQCLWRGSKTGVRIAAWRWKKNCYVCLIFAESSCVSMHRDSRNPPMSKPEGRRESGKRWRKNDVEQINELVKFRIRSTSLGRCNWKDQPSSIGRYTANETETRFTDVLLGRESRNDSKYFAGELNILVHRISPIFVYWLKDCILYSNSVPILFKECSSLRIGVEPSFIRWIWLCSAWVMTSGGTKSCPE